MKRLPILLASAAVALCVAVFAFLALSRPGETRPIRIAINPWPGYEFLYLAQQRGFLLDEGLNIELVPFENLEDVRLAYERGDVDGICSTVTEVLQAHENVGRRANIVLVPDTSNGADVIIARQGIRSVRELRGRRVAVEPQSVNILVLYFALLKNDMKLSDVEILYMPSVEKTEAFASGTIDAVVSYPPDSLEIADTPGARTIFSSAETPGAIIDVIAIDAAALEAAPPDFVPALRRAWTRALDYAAASHQEAYALMAEREGISVADFEMALSGVQLLTVEEQVAAIENGQIEASVLRTSQALAETGSISRAVSNPREFVWRSTSAP